MILQGAWVFLVLFAATGHAQTCPTGCSCSTTSISCNGLSTFPEFDFPDVTRITIDRPNCSIPSNAFEKMPKLQYITICMGNIPTIESCAFTGLQYVTSIYIFGNTIGTIKPGAFSEIDARQRLYIYTSEIEEISSNAFYNLSSLYYFQLYSVKIARIQSYAFNNLEGSTFRIYDANITTLGNNAFNVDGMRSSSMYRISLMNIGCQSLEQLSSTPYDVTVRCDCDLLPLIKASAIGHPIHCFNDSEIHDVMSGFGETCTNDVPLPPPACTPQSQSTAPYTTSYSSEGTTPPYTTRYSTTQWPSTAVTFPAST